MSVRERVSDIPDPPAVSDNDDSATQGGTPGRLPWQKASPGSLDHLDGGGPLSMMLPRTSDSASTPDRDAPTNALSVVTTPPEPDPREWRSRCLLALALLNHRASGSDVLAQLVRRALLGETIYALSSEQVRG